MALATWALISLDDAKRHLGVTQDEQNEVVSSMIESASYLCEKFTSRQLKSRAYTNEVYDGTGKFSLRLRQFPITAVTAVSFLTSWAPDVWTPISLAVYPVTVQQPVLDTILFRNIALPPWPQSVSVSYTAGFVDVPAPLKDACRQILLALWKQRDKQLAGVHSTTAFGQTVVYDTEAIPPMARELLGGYVRMM